MFDDQCDETGLTEDCSDIDRISQTDIELRKFRDIDELLKHKSKNQNLGHKHNQKPRENWQFNKEEYSKIPQTKIPEELLRHINERIYPNRNRNSQQNQLNRKSAGHNIDISSKKERVLSPPPVSLVDRCADLINTDKIKTRDHNKHFPFHKTPSGHFKILPDQVVYSSKKLSVLVANPDSTKVNIQEELKKSRLKSMMPPIPSKFFQQPQPQHHESKLRSLKHSGGDECEEEESLTSLKPEIKLERLGYSNDGKIDYSKVKLPSKTNLYREIYRRISNYVLTDCEVIIDQEAFSCHSIVLQSYSEYFQNAPDCRRIEVPKNTIDVNAFVTVYDWMIMGEDCETLLTRTNILQIFKTSRVLKMKELEEQCWAFLDSEEVFSEDTAFTLYIEAKKLNLPEVKDLMIPRIREFFLMLVSTQDYVELDVDEVYVLLNSNYIAVNCEIEVLMSAIRWIKHDWSNRVIYSTKLLSCIRFGLIAPWQLVDIRRNPENPEILEIMSMPEVSKMADDGLSFVIIKYWYGYQVEDFSNWIELLGLFEPVERNWLGSEKNYVTYKEFLNFLHTYRRDRILERNNNNNNNNNINKAPESDILESLPHQPCYPPSDLCLPTPSVIAAQRPKTPGRRSPRRSPEREQQRFDMDVTATTFSTEHSFPLEEEMYTKRDINPSKFQPIKVLSMFSTQRYNQKTNQQGNINVDKYLRKGSLFSRDRETVLVFGGLDPHTQCGMKQNTGNDVYRYLPETNSWEFVCPLLEPRQHHSTAFFRGRVYLVGGSNPKQTDDKDKTEALDMMYSFDPVGKSWHKERPMNIARKNFGLVVYNMKLYAIGGQNKSGRLLSSVERYEPGGDWEEVASLNAPRMGMACAKYRNCIWAVGGMSGSKKNPLTNIVECYEAGKNQWTRIENLRFPRCFACLFTMSDKLYLIGGAGRLTEKDKNTQSVGTIDVWDDMVKEWKPKAELSIPRHGHAIAYLGTQVLVIGGVTTVYMRALSNVECYCCDRFTWVRGISPLPITVSGHTAVTLPPASMM